MKIKALIGIGFFVMGLSSAMGATIQSSAVFPGVKAERLYQIYLFEHEAFTGAPATISPVEGGSFSAFGGKEIGKLFRLVPGRLIVQSMGETTESGLESTVVLTFSQTQDGAQIDLIQVNVPDDHQEEVKNNWQKYYWSALLNYVQTHQ